MIENKVYNDNGLLAYWPFDEGKGKTAINNVNGKSSEISYVFSNAKFKPSSDPVWLKGIKGSALLFDGFSTWLEDSEGIFKDRRENFAISFWAAPRCSEYNENDDVTAVINQHNDEKAEGFILGLKGFGVLSFKASVDGIWYEVNCKEKTLVTGKWTHVTAVFNGTEGFMELYIDGDKAGEKRISTKSVLALSTEPLIIGKSNNSVKINGIYEVACFCGALDELKVYDKALNSMEIRNMYEEYLEACNGRIPKPDLSIDRKIFEGDRYRPLYHFIAPGYWMNEPHGPMFFNGQYHLFFQHNPHGPLWRNINWGHAESEDMVHWRDVPCALSPGKDELDSRGDWSGCCIVDNGLPTIIYTAGDGPIYSQCTALARSTFNEDGNNDLVKWVKHKEPIIIQDKNIKTEKGELHYGQFRDPFVWKEENRYYALIGSGVKDNNESVGGTALLYTSEDLYNWKYEKPLYVGDYKKYPKTGEVWELPVFLPIGKDSKGNMKHIFLINPWFFAPSPHNVKYVWYWVGTWDKETLTFQPDSDLPELIDVGEHFTGPSGMVDPKGRTIIFSIAQGKRTGMDECLSGWAHNGGLPISIFLREDGRLGVEPVSELQSLRKYEYVSIENMSVESVNKEISAIQDDCIEIQLEIDGGSSDEFGIILRMTPDAEEETLLYYKKSTNEILIDRNKSTINAECERGISGGKLNMNIETLKLHIFLDKSMIEAYVNNLKGLTSRIYPTREDALGLAVFADKNEETVRIKSLRIWKLCSAYY